MKVSLIAFLLLFASGLHSQVAINSDGSSPDSSAILDLKSTEKGFLPPRMTKAELISIFNPAEGLVVFCTDCAESGTGVLVLFQTGSWRIIDTDCLTAPPGEAYHVPGLDQIEWKWYPVLYVAGYKWNTTNDYATATDMGMDTSFTETGLLCNTPYTRYVWAYNICGRSSPLSMTISTAGCFNSPCGQPVTVSHIAGEVAPVNKTVVYSTVSGVPGEPALCWITQNLGSDRQALNVDDNTEESAGWYWQFNHKQGYKHDGTIRTPNTDWITAIDDLSDWEQCNDPCNLELGSEWRIPSYSEWFNVDNESGWETYNDPWNSSLKLHAAGDLYAVDGSFDGRGDYGYYWSSNGDGEATAWMLSIQAGGSLFFSANKSFGMSLRCVKDTCGLLSPGAGVHTSGEYQIVWKWTGVSGATCYKWNTTNDITTAINIGTDTLKTETGLSCNTPLTRYVWACNDCGNSMASLLSDSTLTCSFICGTSTITVEHIAGDVAPVSKTVTYGTVTNIPGEEEKCWITQNLGSDRQALSVNDATEPSAGWYWQFNRKQGFKNDGINLTPAAAWYTGNGNLSDWEPVNDPCVLELGTGWRIPTQTEWSNVDVSGNWTNWTGPWNSDLKLHSAGNLQSDDGELLDIGDVGAYWSSKYSDLYNSWKLYFYPAGSSIDQSGRNTGVSIRCIKNCDPPPAPSQRTHNATPSQIIWQWYPVPGVTGYKINSLPIFNGATDVGNNTSKTETGLPCNCGFTRYCWAYNACGISPSPAVYTKSTSPDPPPKPVALNAVPSPTEIMWRWEPVPGASGYMWNTTYHSNTAVDIGSPTSYTQTGLTCLTSYSSYVWAYNDACGQSTFTSLSATTSANPPPTPTEGTHYTNGDTIIWHWSSVPGADYYYITWSTNVPNYQSAYIYDTCFTQSGCVCNVVSRRYVWAHNSCGNSIPVLLTQRSSQTPVSPVAAEHSPTSTRIIWNWHPVSMVFEYAWNTTDDFNSAISTGINCRMVENGLDCSETYTRYVWAINSCGMHSLPTALTATTFQCFDCGTQTLTINHNVSGGVAPVNKTVTYLTATGIPGPGETVKCWIAQNLGADRQALSVDDVTLTSAGWWWQFNRACGHLPNSGGYCWWSQISEYSDWSITNDPCRLELGFPWRLPTISEWESEDNNGFWVDWNDAWNSDLKLHAAGYLHCGSSFEASSRGTEGLFWSSDNALGFTEGREFKISSNIGCYSSEWFKCIGHSVRCLRE
jgi:hypothetical protein